MTDTENWTPIRIEAPLPNMVALALMKSIGKMWPEAVILGGGHSYALDMRIPPAHPEDLDQEFADQIRKDVDDDHEEFDFLGFRDGHVAFAPPEELCVALGNIAHSIFTAHQPDAINHVEWDVKTGDEPGDPKYVLSISVLKGKTPLAMRKQAEAELESVRAEMHQRELHHFEVEQENAALKALLDEKGIDY